MLGYLLGRWVALPWPHGSARDMLQGAGFVSIGLALLLAFLAIRELRKHNTTVSPIGKSSHLVTTGPYAFSRNPIYLANFLLTSGLGFAFGNAWLLVMALLAAWLEQQLAITREERFMESHFGKGWRDYAKRVRRWI